MAFLSTWHPVRSTAVHDPVLGTGESPYLVMILIGQFWSLVLENWSVDVQGHDVTPCSNVNFAVKFLDLCQWGMVSTIVAWCACCPPAYWGYSLTSSSCGGTSLPVVLFEEVGCVVLYIAIVAMFLVLLEPSAHGHLLIFSFFSCPLLYPLPSIPLTCKYPSSVPSSHTCSTLHLQWGTPSLGVKVLFHSWSKTCKYSDFCVPYLVPSCCVSHAPCVVYLHLGSELQWLLWQWHSDFGLCWAACLNYILLKLFELYREGWFSFCLVTYFYLNWVQISLKTEIIFFLLKSSFHQFSNMASSGLQKMCIFIIFMV